MNHADIPVFSMRVVRALEALEIGGIQYLAVKILNPEDKQVDLFNIANIQTVVPALELSKCDAVYFGDERPDKRGEVLAIRRYCLRSDFVKAYDVIRAREYPESIFVSERIARLFQHNSFTGWGFYSVQST